MTVIVVLICCCIPNFNKIGSRVRPSDAHNCWMYNAPLPWQPQHGGHIGNMMGCDHPSFVQIGPLMRVITFPTFSNMAAVSHLEFKFCDSEPPTKSAMLFDYPVKIWCRSGLPRRRYCDFIILPVWLENAFFGSLKLKLKLWVVIQTTKRHILGWRRVI